MKERVLMFGWEFPPKISGGLGTACLGMTKALAKQNVDVLFVMPRASGEENQQFVEIVNAAGVAVPYETRVDANSSIEYLWVCSNLLPYNRIDDMQCHEHEETFTMSESKYGCYPFQGGYGVNLGREVYQYALVAEQLATRERFDVIHAHDWLTYPAGVMAKRVSGKPLVIHVHATEYDRSGENVDSRVWNIEKMGMENADKIITVSNRTRDIVIHRYGIDASKVFTVYNGVEFDTESKESKERKIEDKIVTFLGRVTYQKGPEYFIEAAYKVLQRCPNVQFVMAGSGDMLYKSIKRVAQLKIGSRFHFTGFLTGKNVGKMYAMSDVYVMPSVSEPFGISPLEAIRSGVPTIVSKQSGVAEVLKYALKVDFWDIDAMADAIYGLLQYPALSDYVSQYALQEVDDLSWDEAAIEIKQIYNSLI
ncbi:MAG: glycosyltransferase family 4 protein [Marinifilaceae bacterium]